ncbi:DUF3316 domain-containing protein [Parabacteroides acidifaciens]|uniref:DUF3316 domain-containing protein n=1 Tax=Parabacteroides acidifaciens TaxID=2290935 RepID=A0A3D8HH89_9BACT|nr:MULTISPECIES: DUF3316 domain-containing protein [Parabacteroides]MBC8601003.1 DUF3316 domain-containing protein [Parabacteroides acidifaciens]RDU50339.1 DUF3316 domain-containing protein [Parabacteroides acidifaciens]
MKKTACLMFLFLWMALPLVAQSDEEEVPRSINESTMVGIGGYNLRDTYLSPSTDINYTGWVARILNERMKVVRLADYKISRQQLINVEFGSTRNGAETANEYAGFVDYSLGYHYRFTNLLPGLKVLTGASARLSGGFIYNTRNSNNPVSGKGDFDLNLSAMAIYNFKIKEFPLTFRYQAEIPFAGVLFSVHKGEPYYFLTQGGSDGIVRFSSFHNKFAMKNYFTLDIPVSNFTLRVGYLNSMYRTDVNSIKTHVLSNSFMIGFVKEFVSFGGKRLKSNAHRYSSAYY